MTPTKLTDTQIQNTLRSAVEDAAAYIESDVAPARTEAARYFDGAVSLEHEEGRSKVVATKCRDVVRAIKPAIARVFLQSDKPVEFIPTRADAVGAAEQATAYASYVFYREKGFQKLMDVVHDALVKKIGVMKVFYEEDTEAEIEEYTGLTADELGFLSQDGVEVLEASQDEFGNFNLKVSRVDTNGSIRFETVAPEDFFIDAGATTVEDAYVCGHSTQGRVGDLVAMGFDFEEVLEHAGMPGETDEEFERNSSADDDDESEADASMRKVLITEAYMRMDVEGTGVPQRHKFICVGDKYHILSREAISHRPFAIFEVDPEPHTFFGRSLVELVMNDQNAATALLRGLLDGLQFMNSPRVEVDISNIENIDEVLNNEIGAVIQKKRPEPALTEVVSGAAATAALPAIQFYDESIRAKTGVLGAAMGMDADALQGNTATGVDAAVQAATAQSELIARYLAEGGMRELFETFIELASAHPQRDEMMRVDGQFVPVDPTSWSRGMDCRANVGLGTNRQSERQAALMQTIQDQNAIFQAYGPQNGLVSMTNLRNARADVLKSAGIHNSDRYYQPMDPQIEAKIMAQRAEAAAQQQQTDPNAAFLQVEGMKVQQKEAESQRKGQLDAQKAQAEINLKSVKMIRDDDRERDKMAQDRVIELAKAQTPNAGALDARIVREQMMPRG